MVPRFIISIRELYDRDLRGSWEGNDVGFGVLSRPAASGTLVSAIAFAEANPGQSQAAEGDAEDVEGVAGSSGNTSPSRVVEDDAGASELIRLEALDRARLV